ncbi:MAG: RICIN domain-containing protein [Lachnospiraceae bacterium]|nr:RICIN domain-containing protein [Lachnospiraceae bacterium]
MKKRNLLKRIFCLLLVAILTVHTGAGIAQAQTMSWINITDFKPMYNAVTFQWYTEMTSDTTPFDGKYYYKECIPKGETVYIEQLYESCTGQYYIVDYKGKGYYLYKSSIEKLNKVNKPKRTTKKDVVKKKGLAGDVQKPNDYCYIYSSPDDSKAANCYGCVPAGTAIEILDKNYNADWMKIRYKKYYVCYIKKADVNIKDAYLAGAAFVYQPYIKLAKKAKLTYSGILKDYDKTLTKKEMCRLAVLWYKAMGNKLPKQKKTSPYKDTKDKYVIMAHQLGIIKSTSNKKFSPNKALTAKSYNAIVNKLMKVTGASDVACAVARKNGWAKQKVTRDEAIVRLYKALLPSYKTGYLVNDNQVDYAIVPYDNQKVCLDVMEESRQTGAIIGLWDYKGSTNQRFYIDCNNGICSIKNRNSNYTLTYSSKKVCQQLQGYTSQKITFEYNDDGTVCIKNGYGQYLDIVGGNAVSGGKLFFNDKTGSSSQKFVFKY